MGHLGQNVASKQIRHSPPQQKRQLDTLSVPSVANIPEVVHHGQIQSHNEPAKPLSQRSRPVSANSNKLFQELISLKADLLQNQDMIRKELQIHKEQIAEQMTAQSKSEK